MKTLRWLVWPILAAVIVALPWVLYLMRAEHRLELVLVDKTVPFPNRIEHRSLFWLLDRLRVVKPDGTPYDVERDYLGAFPGEPPGHPPARTVDLDREATRGADLVYLIDTYGVYEDDLVSAERMEAALDRSRKIYGGLTADEARAVAAAHEDGASVVVEFNGFASPTGAAAREVVEELLGVRWTRWIGRFFADLADEREVPPWMRRNYEREWSREWDFDGPGYVLVQDDAQIEVLRVGVESRRIGLRLSRTRPLDPLLARARDEVPYPYWFDVVRAERGTAVLAEYRWELTDEGRARLRARGLPEAFPAVTRRTRATPGGAPAHAFYFAGDFADNPLVSRRVPLVGYMRLRGFLEGSAVAPSEEAFFWRFYAPMMERILLEAADARR